MVSKRNPFEDWLMDVMSDVLLVDDNADGLVREARDNLWTFSISQDQSRTVTDGDVLAFLSAVYQAWERQILERLGTTHPMVFYCWFDEQASQLRLSLISASHNGLPFGAQVVEITDLEQVVNQFLRSPYHDGLPLEEFIPQDSSDDAGDAEKFHTALLVWMKTLPRGSRAAKHLTNPETSKIE